MSQEPQQPQQWKRDEKDDRDEKDEKSRGEKSRGSDGLSTVVWAAIFVWAGLVLLAGNLGLFVTIAIDGHTLEAWNIILAGAGVIVLIEVAIRLILPAYRRRVTGSLIFAVILLAIGLGGAFGWNVVWPLILILIGVSILVGSLTNR
jgi:hypothetical protein